MPMNQNSTIWVANQKRVFWVSQKGMNAFVLTTISIQAFIYLYNRGGNDAKSHFLNPKISFLNESIQKKDSRRL